MADKHLSLSENEDIVGISIEDSITESQEIDPPQNPKTPKPLVDDKLLNRN